MKKKLLLLLLLPAITFVGIKLLAMTDWSEWGMNQSGQQQTGSSPFSWDLTPEEEEEKEQERLRNQYPQNVGQPFSLEQEEIQGGLANKPYNKEDYYPSTQEYDLFENTPVNEPYNQYGPSYEDEDFVFVPK